MTQEDRLMPTMLTRQAAKFWAALLGTIVAAVLVAWPDAPRWLTILSAALTAVAVYLVPNEQPPERLGEHAKP